MGIEVSIDYDPRIRGTRIWIVQEKADGFHAFRAIGFEDRIVSPSEELEPTFVFGRREGHEFLQELSDALVRAGFKPDEIEASSKQVAAIKNHLEDMRTLVFKGK